jgi:replication-associated recombination protein RarA
LGYAKNYEWSENRVGPTAGQSFLPDKLKGRKFILEDDKEKK